MILDNTGLPYSPSTLVLLFIAWWSTLWAFCRRFKLLCDPRGDSLMPSVVHSCSVFFLFIKLVVDPQVFDGVGIGAPNTVPHVCGLACCLGWFVVDTYSDLFATKTPPTAAMILHHVFCLAVFAVPLYAGYGGGEICMFGVIAEVSNPFFQLSLAFKGQPAELPFSVMFAATFVPARAYFGTRLMVHTVRSATHPVIKICVVAVMAISYYWMVLIVRKTLRKVGGGAGSKTRSSGQKTE